MSSALKITPYFAFGQEMVSMPWHRYLVDNIKKMRLGVGVSTSLFTTPQGFPILAIKDVRDSYVLGEVFYLNQKGLESVGRLYAKEFPEAKLHHIKVREVDVFQMAGFRGSDAIEKQVLTFGIPYSEATYNVSQGRLRYSIHNSYHSEMASPSPVSRKSYPHKTYVPVNFTEVEDE